MPREPKAGSFVIARVAPPEPTPPHMAWMMIDQVYAVPMRFSVTFELSEPAFIVTIDVAMEGTRASVARLEAIRGRRNERNFMVDTDDGVTTTNLRQVLVDRLVRRAVEAVRQPVEFLPEETRAALIRGGAMPHAVERGVSTMFRVPGVTPPGQYQFSPRPGGGARESTKVRIAEAADFYKQAVANGSKSPQKDAALAMGISTSQASRYLKSARDAGLLDEPKKPLSEMSAEDYTRMREGMGTSELDPERHPGFE